MSWIPLLALLSAMATVAAVLVIVVAPFVGAFWLIYRRDRAIYHCTRCGRTSEVARADGCQRGPCPMALRGGW